MKKEKILSFFSYFLTFIFGLILGFYLFLVMEQPSSISHQTNIRESGYTYINPLLDCDSGVNLEDKALKNIKFVVFDEVAELKKKGFFDSISVYYRDLNNGPWFGINEDENFSPASLLKVPVMIGILKQAESNPQILNEEVLCMQKFLDQESQELLPEYLPDDYLVEGKIYTVSELIDRMIDYSDNDAFDMLSNFLDFNQIKKMHEDLGIVYPEKGTPQDFVSVKSYSSLFRVLYNSSYLNREYSEKALEILANATFDRGLAFGVPGDINVANKFGIRVAGETSEKNQLHDCGIIYYPENPYLLCIMTRGDDLDLLADSIGKISKTIYELKSAN